ncbi:hypothetical protein HHI36_013606 [Cryptolaemus montrouzieri]|uniref:Mitochondrial import inner membrane translocase subunit TIM50 n=1 Tax=Cryptolaemus montrouzieri TaxID=559131 RepID=A0ABD2NHK1_9CUCU
MFKMWSYKFCSKFLQFRRLPISSGISYAFINNVPDYHTHCSQRLITKLENNTSNKKGPDDKETENTIKSIKYSLIGLGVMVLGASIYFILTYGQPRVDDEGNKIDDEFSALPVWLQYMRRSIYEIQKFALFIQQPSRQKLLPDPVKFPYQQPPYTLVLEIKDILVHPEWTYNTGWRFKKRPGIDYFLESLAGMYEIVVFTAEQGFTVFPLVEALDPKNLISYKLVRDATHFVDGHHVKNLDKLNRDLSKVIVIDWNDESVKFHNDNLLNIGQWNGSYDNTLIDLTSFLATIAQNEVEDVREVLKYYKTFENPLATFRQKQKEIFQQEKDSATPKIETPRKSHFY